ncbi:MAG: TIGR02302 family protein [Azospirillum sp.]|nr:TIGR02302 family protein [Azospirillum sp.]
MTAERGETPARLAPFKQGLARAALIWERLWPALWPATGVAGGFLALALFNLLPALPGWLHLAIVLAAAAAVAGLLWRGLSRLTLPDHRETLRRLERDSGLVHRPLHALQDTLSNADHDPIAAALWRRHRDSMAGKVRRLRVALPHPGLAARDPWALRALVGLVLFVAAAGSWGDWVPRLYAALSPRFGGGATPPALDVWLTPPAYTGLAPSFLKSDGGNAATTATAEVGTGPLAVPIGSVVLARLSGGRGVPRLTVNGGTTDFAANDGSQFLISQTVERGESIAVDQDGRRLGHWAISVKPDAPPTIVLAEPPSATEHFALKLDYVVADDYGVDTARAELRRPRGDPAEDAKAVESPVLGLPLTVPGGRPKQAQAVSFHDLTAHPWAGLPVLVRLVATDGAGQTGQSAETTVVLPERRFNHPVARAVIAQRKHLVEQGDPVRVAVSRALSALSSRPAAFQGDLTTFLALRVAVARLLLSGEDGTLDEVVNLLWETALRIEEGGVAVAERQLRDAEQALGEALDRNAGDAELRQLMDQLQQALDQYLDAVEQRLREAAAQGQKPPELPPELAQQMLDRSDLQSMLDQMRDMAETGARDGARQMLSQLQQMLETLRAGAQGGQGQDQGRQMLRELQQMTEQQRELLDHTFQQSQGPENQSLGQAPSPLPLIRPPGRSGQRHGGRNEARNDGAHQQTTLRHRLGDLMRRLGEATGDIPRPLGNAERAMRDAEMALGAGQPDAAVPSQSEAVDQLQQGLRGLAQQLAEQAAGSAGGGTRPDASRPGRGRDPLGRPSANFGGFGNDDVRIPEQAELQRAREILDELRRRAGQFSRPRLELDYIDRLLRQF